MKINLKFYILSIATQALLLFGCCSKTVEDVALEPAIVNGNVTAVRRLIVESPDLLQKRDQYGNTPLLSACSYGRRNVAEVLIKAGADLNASNDRGETPLIMVAGSEAMDELEIVEMLVKNGARLEDMDNEGNTALLVAVTESCWDIAMFLLEAGADPDVQNKRGVCPLHMVSVSHDLNTGQKILSMTKKINARDKKGLSALDYAKMGDDRGMTILRNGTKLPIRDAYIEMLLRGGAVSGAGRTSNK